MSKAVPRRVLFATTVIAVSTLAAAGQAQLPPIPSAEHDPAAPFLAAIMNERTSVIEEAPKCGEGTKLTGPLVLETPEQPGFPLSATTVSTPQGTFTTITTMTGVSGPIIDQIAKALNQRAIGYVMRLERNCSL